MWLICSYEFLHFSIIIIDNVQIPQNQRNSSKLKGLINKAKPDINISQVYTLAGGGIALHCKDKASQELALGDWANTGLNPTGKPKPHKIKGLQDSQVVVVKSVNTRYSEKELLQEIKVRYPSASNVHRLYNRINNTPFPIIKVTLSCSEASAILKNQIHIFGQNLTCESCRSTKVVRCYQCQRFGHTANFCVFGHRCVNCSDCHNQS